MWTAGWMVAFMLAFLTALHLPTPPRLELYDVGDLTYSLGGFPGVDISLATKPPPIWEADLMMTGDDLATRLRPLVPGDEATVQFQNGMLIVRGTSLQHLTIRTALFAHRSRNAAISWAIDGISGVKAALCAKVFGMITP